MEMNRIRFEETPRLYNPSLAFVAHLSGVTNKETLLSTLCKELKFPNYFGFNWDALYDLLRDFDWIKERRIVLVHDTLPILDYENLYTYVEILYDSVYDWKDDENHYLEVVFPKDCESIVKEILDNKINPAL
ncbi:Barstar barnase inhibitor [Mucilaginibacter gotjawali]|uniref:Barstar barnase inhibitor n=2 Tax=Mucilaginibacter gotjawali TaxID=1550579 RepID=A0A120MZ74_9SPHI|nr:Barstar barnase inhibitor [Mucilaginibacter gotjawali]